MSGYLSRLALLLRFPAYLASRIPALWRYDFRDVRLTLTDAGGLLCLGKTGSSGQDELLWSAVTLGEGEFE